MYNRKSFLLQKQLNYDRLNINNIYYTMLKKTNFNIYSRVIEQRIKINI